MQTIEENAKKYTDEVVKLWSDFDWERITFDQFKNKIKNLFEKIQKEAYNQVLKDAGLCNDIKELICIKLNDSEKQFKTL